MSSNYGFGICSPCVQLVFCFLFVQSLLVLLLRGPLTYDGRLPCGRVALFSVKEPWWHRLCRFRLLMDSTRRRSCHRIWSGVAVSCTTFSAEDVPYEIRTTLQAVEAQACDASCEVADAGNCSTTQSPDRVSWAGHVSCSSCGSSSRPF